MRKIVVLNSKGGSGKTTIATNLAAYFALQGKEPTLMDMDRQGSATHWLKKRFADQPVIHGIEAWQKPSGVTLSWHRRIPMASQCVIVDAPAALDPYQLPELTRDAEAIIVPVLPSDIDIHAVTRLIADLLLIARIRRSDGRIGIVANRVKSRTLAFDSLMRFLDNLRIPIVGVLRDSQAYVRSAELGLGVHELKARRATREIEQWESLVNWIKTRPERALRSVTAV